MNRPLSNVRVVAAEGVLVRQLENESVLLNLDSESYFGLDEIGTRMWGVLTDSPSVEAAVEKLVAEFDVEPGQLRADLSELIQKLEEAGLIRVTDL